MTNQLSDLRRFIVTHYGLDDLRILCADLGIPYDDLGGQGVRAKAQELILALGRRHHLDRLLAALQQTRSDAFAAAGLSADSAAVDALCDDLSTFEPPASTTGVSAQGPGAIAAGPGAVVGQINAPVATGRESIAAGGDVVIARDSAVQTGGIRARRIEADHVVDGVQLQGGAPADPAGLVELARAIQRGGITADEIEAGDVVSGLQFIGGSPPATADDLRQEVAALRTKVAQAIAAGEIAKAGDAEDVADALTKAEAELSAPEPDRGRVLRQLETAAKVLTAGAAAVEAAGKLGPVIATLAPKAAALWELARSILGG